MARIIFESYMFRYPLAGMQSWVLQYLLGLKALGHDVYLFEKYGYDNSCYDPSQEIMSNDCSYGLQLTAQLLKSHGLENNWCFVAWDNTYHGMSKLQVEEVFKTADIHIDMGSYGNWQEESVNVPLKILIEGEPGYTQIRMIQRKEAGNPFPEYHRYFTNGFNVGTNGNETPTAGLQWEHVFHPVNTRLFSAVPSIKGAPYTSIMNWRSQLPVEFNGKIYGQKDVEFMRFIKLPAGSPAPMEIALGGGAGVREVPVDLIRENGWTIRNSRKVTVNFDSFRGFLAYSRGEFRICKNVFVSLNTGWFSDTSAAYLASGRPVIAQDTGFAAHLPCGKGLFAVKDPEEALAAIQEIESNYALHARAAREIAEEYLEGEKVMKGFMEKLT